MTAPSADPSKPRVDRPWGWYETVSESPGSLVKRIRLAAGQQISLQKHAHRAEHWVVVEGTAHVTVGGLVMELAVGQHVDIAVGVVHRLANRTLHPVEIVEIQLGTTLLESDIVRLQDDYGRA
jgi:mannose-6-phosphate isomerase